MVALPYCHLQSGRVHWMPSLAGRILAERPRYRNIKTAGAGGSPSSRCPQFPPAISAPQLPSRPAAAGGAVEYRYRPEDAMTTAVDAIYQNGVFRPTTPPDL